MVSKAERVKLKLKELDRLLAGKKITPEKYLDMKTNLELQFKEKSVEAAKGITKPKALSLVCPHCGSPQRQVKGGVKEFVCEMCGKVVKLFDAAAEAKRLLEKIPDIIEGYALQQLFINPGKVKLEAGLRSEMAAKHEFEKISSIMVADPFDKMNPLTQYMAGLHDVHGFRFLTVLSDTNISISYTITELNAKDRPLHLVIPKDFLVIVPSYVEASELESETPKIEYDDLNFDLWLRTESEEILAIFNDHDRAEAEKAMLGFRKDFAEKKGATSFEELSERDKRVAEKDFLLKVFEMKKSQYDQNTLTQALLKSAYHGLAGKLLSSQKGKKAAPTAVLPWNDVGILEFRANVCLATVKAFNELANNFAIFGAYARTEQMLNFFTPVVSEKWKSRLSRFGTMVGARETTDKMIQDAEDKRRMFFGAFPPICWANFYEGLAAYAQAYGKLLLFNKESIEKKTPIRKLPVSESIDNFNKAGQAFKRAATHGDKPRKPYLDFYAAVCNGLRDVLRGQMKAQQLSQLEAQKMAIVKGPDEHALLALNEGAVGNRYVGLQGFYSRGTKRWRVQRLSGLARALEGPRFLFALDVLLIRDLLGKASR